MCRCRAFTCWIDIDNRARLVARVATRGTVVRALPLPDCAWAYSGYRLQSRRADIDRSHAPAWECSWRRSASLGRRASQDGLPRRSVGTIKLRYVQGSALCSPGCAWAYSGYGLRWWIDRSHAPAWERSWRRSASLGRRASQDGLPRRSVGTIKLRCGQGQAAAFDFPPVRQ